MSFQEVPVGLIYRGFRFTYCSYLSFNFDNKLNEVGSLKFRNNDVLRAVNKNCGFALELSVDKPIKEMKNELKEKIDKMFESNIIKH